jgi:D-xylono/L-arabinono-1,4-lactonase
MTMEHTQPELIVDVPCLTGEGPLWHPEERRLYWTDIPAGRLYRYDPSTGRHEQVYQGEPVGGFTIQADGALLLFMARGAVKIWRSGKLRTVIDEIPEERDSRFNDVIADPEGRVFCGTMSVKDAAGQVVRYGRLYRLDPDGSLTVMLEGIGTSNGLGFTPDRAQVYYADTPRHEIYRFDYDRASGKLANRQLFVRSEAGGGRPDGLTVDADGYVWAAHWDGSCLVRFAPDGREDRRFTFPARKVSCPTFGGDDYSDLYVTTAGGDDRVANGPGAGALFRLRPGVKGRAEFRSRVLLEAG